MFDFVKNDALGGGAGPVQAQAPRPGLRRSCPRPAGPGDTAMPDPDMPAAGLRDGGLRGSGGLASGHQGPAARVSGVRECRAQAPGDLPAAGHGAAAPQDSGAGAPGPLRRPGLLLRAAAAGQAGYDRNRDLRRLLQGALPSPERAVRRLEELEHACETSRRSGEFTYSAARHVAVLIAVLAERRLLASAVAASRRPAG